MKVKHGQQMDKGIVSGSSTFKQTHSHRMHAKEVAEPTFERRQEQAIQIKSIIKANRLS